MAEVAISLVGTTHYVGVGGAPPLLVRMMQHMGFTWLPEYMVYARTRAFGLTNYFAMVHIQPRNVYPYQPFTFEGHGGTFEEAVQVAAYNAMCYLRW
jgi:hypothetical protein